MGEEQGPGLGRGTLVCVAGRAKGLTGETRTVPCLWKSASPERAEANLFHFEEKLGKLEEKGKEAVTPGWKTRVQAEDILLNPRCPDVGLGAVELPRNILDPWLSH